MCPCASVAACLAHVCPSVQARSLVTTASGTTQRHRAVADMFPKLAYTTSDVLVVVCREPFYNRRYLERCIDLAKRANSGVHNVDHPALVLIGNKLPGEECELDVRKSTAQFFEAWGAEGDTLHQYFSAIVAIYIPHKRGMWLNADDVLVNGAEVFAQQMTQLKVRTCCPFVFAGCSYVHAGVPSCVDAAAQNILNVMVSSRVQAASRSTSPRFLSQRQVCILPPYSRFAYC